MAVVIFANQITHQLRCFGQLLVKAFDKQEQVLESTNEYCVPQNLVATFTAFTSLVAGCGNRNLLIIGFL